MTVATARSDRGWGNWPTTVPVVTVAGGAVGSATAWTVATVSGEPPPKTKVVLPMVAVPASWVGSASVAVGAMAPVPGTMVDTPASEVPAGVMPPSTVRVLPLATTVSRDSGAPSGHASTPASMDGGPCRPCWALAAPTEPAAEAGWGTEEPVPERGGVVEAVVAVVAVPPLHDATMTPATTSTTRAATLAARHRWRRMPPGPLDLSFLGHQAPATKNRAGASPLRRIRSCSSSRMQWAIVSPLACRCMKDWISSHGRDQCSRRVISQAVEPG